MTEEKLYLINEIYYTIQGEGRRWGTPHVFVRFSQCNLTCGFCDTEFESYMEMTAFQVLTEAEKLTALPSVSKTIVPGAIVKRKSTVETAPCRNVMFCGGEPLLQLDEEFLSVFKDQGWYTVIETNGTRPVPKGVDWIACSPKVAEHALAISHVNELKYLRGNGQGIPRPSITADHYLISPIFEGNTLDNDTLQWCLELVKNNPQWTLTVQHHKTSFGQVR